MTATEQPPLETPQPTVLPSLLRMSYRLRADATQQAGADGTIVLHNSRFELTLPSRLGAGFRAVVLRLGQRWVDDDEVSQIVASVDGEAKIMRARLMLHQLVTHSWLDRRLRVDDRPLLHIRQRALGPGSHPELVRHDPLTHYRLSQYAIIRAEGDTLIGYTPRTTTTITFADRGLAQILVLAAAGGCVRQEVATAASVTDEVAGHLLDVLITAGLLVSCADHDAECTAPPHVFWSPEELAVHDRSRAGRHVQPIGGTYRLRDELPPEPVRHPPVGATTVDLPVPDLDSPEVLAPSFSRIVRSRRSIRTHDDDRPITRDQIAEFLYRVGRTWDVRVVDGQEVGRRPYPSGGQTCELEIYPLVFRCQGIEPALYHYDSLDHRLTRMAGWNRFADRLLRYARGAAMMTTAPQVLLLCTARISRLMWKYEGLGYPMVLKNAGVLTGLMYMVATAMGLAPCAVGSGDSAAFAAMTGLDPLVEPTVADFVLGSRIDARSE
jgi:SagB-type dehydrogenase family enzyme